MLYDTRVLSKVGFLIEAVASCNQTFSSSLRSGDNFFVDSLDGNCLTIQFLHLSASP